MKEAQKFIKPQPYLKRLKKSFPMFMKHYWINSWGLVLFSGLTLIALFYFLHIDRNKAAFWWSLTVLLGINGIRFFGLLFKWRV